MPKRTIRLEWHGSYALRGSDEMLFKNAEVTNKPGIYLFTVKYRNGYLIYMAGYTSRPFKTRLREHIREYQKGTYHIFSPKAFRNGKRTPRVWRGLWTRKSSNTAGRKKEFQSRKKTLEPIIEELLEAF